MSLFIYTGIGSRRTPEPILNKMTAYGSAFAQMGCLLRSGAAPGADTVFEKGCTSADGMCDIYLPWKGFQNHPSDLHHISQECLEIAADIYGSAWQYLKRPVKLLMARNIYQVLGYDLASPSDFVVCWTPDGCTSRAERVRDTGGTGQAIACASSYDVPVFNLQREGQESKLLDFIGDCWNGTVDTD